MQRYLQIGMASLLLILFAASDLVAQGKPFRRLKIEAPAGLPRILSDNRTCIFFGGPFATDVPLSSLNLSTEQVSHFKRAAAATVHPEEELQDYRRVPSPPYHQKNIVPTPMLEVIDVSQDGKLALLRHLIRHPRFWDQDRPRFYMLNCQVLAVWNTATGQLQTVLDRLETDFTFDAKFLPNGRSIAVSCESFMNVPLENQVGALAKKRQHIDSEYRVDLYDALTGKRIREMGTRQTQGRCLDVSPDGLWIVTAGGTSRKRKTGITRSELVMVEVETGKPVVLQDIGWHIMLTSGPGSISHALFMPDGKRLWANNREWWDVPSAKPIKEPWMQQIPYAGAPYMYTSNRQSLTPDGRFVAIPGQKTPIVLEMTTAQSVTTMADLIGHKKPVTFVAFSPDMTMLLSIATDGEMLVWNLKHDAVGWPK